MDGATLRSGIRIPDQMETDVGGVSVYEVPPLIRNLTKFCSSVCKLGFINQHSEISSVCENNTCYE